ncbi:2939_t:CDS:2 [Diversispora eburnea]|uniref:2939_t:CDS:1 n=1 Tax=Diversispora eburnea TaxID=1213867 RepID=A0A9N8YP83_9GLOM|nr:2939_t:CDS:2 [Diversispora eburnea]
MKLDYDQVLEEAISTERSAPLPLETPECFKISTKKSGIEHILIYRGVREGITPLEHFEKYLKRVQDIETETEDEDAPSSTGLSATKKEIMVQAILDIANVTADQIFSRNFPYSL